MKDALLGPGASEWPGVHYRTILSTAESGGAMSITDTVSPPNSGLPLHIHHDADETFVLLTDNKEFWLKGDRFARGLDQTVLCRAARSTDLW